jgi:LysM repeat protein
MGLTKATIKVEHTGKNIDVMFNPEEYSFNRENNFASQTIPGLSGPVVQFSNGNARTLDMELLFDTYEKQADVRDETQKFVSLMDIDPELHAPPILRFTWASLQFRCVLTRANQKFILFLSDGRPVRARVTVTFLEFLDPEREAKQVSRQTSDFTKVHVVAQAEMLSGIAGKHYGDPTAWRVLAIANELDDPFAIRPGQELIVPSLPFIDAETNEVVA